MRGNDTTFPQGAIQQLEVRLLEERLGGPLGVGGVRNDDVKLVLAVCEEFESVFDEGGDVGVFEANSHTAEVLLGETDDCLRS